MSKTTKFILTYALGIFIIPIIVVLLINYISLIIGASGVSTVIVGSIVSIFESIFILGYPMIYWDID